MTTFHLLLLPGDGIGVETDRRGRARHRVPQQERQGRRFETESDLVGGAAYDKHGVAITDAAMAEGADGRRRDLRRRRRPEVGQGALRDAPRGRPAAAAQGPRPVRQPAPGHLLSGAGRCLLAEARAGRRPRHHDRARADRRRLFRRAQGDRHARERREARRRHPGLHDARDRAHRPRRLRPRPQARATRSTPPKSATS